MLTAAAIMNGSFTRAPACPTKALRLKPSERAFFPLPGRRLISIIGVRSRWRTLGSVTQGEPDREHEQRCNLVGHERVERAVADLEIGKRVRLLDAHAQA